MADLIGVNEEWGVVRGKLNKVVGGQRPLTYYHAGGTDYTAAFAAAMSDVENTLYIPPSATEYLISAPIAYVATKTIHAVTGANVKAAAGFSGPAMITVDNAGTPIYGCDLLGGGKFDADGKVDGMLFAPDAHRSTVEGPRMFGVKKFGVRIGDVTGGASKMRHGNRVKNLEIRRFSEAISYNSSDLSIGLHAAICCNDSWFQDIECVGFNIGMKNDGGANFFTGIHPWTTYYYQPMKYGLWTTKPTLLDRCYADSPSSLGDGSVGEVYGFYVDAYNVSITGALAYLLATDNGNAVSRNNEATAFYFNVASANGCYGSIAGGLISSQDSSVKWKYDVNSSNWQGARNALTVVGVTNDGNVLNTQAGQALISPLRSYGVANFDPAQGGSTRASGVAFNDVITKAQLLALVSPATGLRRTLSDGASGKWEARFDGTNWRYSDGVIVT